MAKGRAAATMVLAGAASLAWATAAHAQEGVSAWELLTRRGSFIVGIGLPQVILGILITITAAAFIYNVIRSLEKPAEEQVWVKQPELDEDAEAEAQAAAAEAAEAAEAQAAAATAVATAAAAAAQAARAQAAEAAPSPEPIFAPLKPAFPAPPPEVTGEEKAPEPPVAPAVEEAPAQAPTAPATGPSQEQYLAPAEQQRPPEPEVPEPEVPEPPPGQAWVDEEDGPEATGPEDA